MSEYALSKFQSKLYEFHKFYKKDPSYNLTACYKIIGNFDIQRFCSIIEMIIAKSDILKAAILEKNNVPYHSVDNLRTNKCEIIQCDDITFEDFFKKVRLRIDFYNQVPISLSEWPLLHMQLFLHPKYGYYLVLAIPHIIFDVYSCYLLFDDISKYYNCDMSLDDIQNSIEHAGYQSYFQAIKPHGDEDQNKEKAITYFKKELEDIENFDIVQIKENREKDGFLKGKYILFSLGSERYKSIQRLAKLKNLSEFSLFLSVYGILLSKILCEQKIVMGIPLATRKSNNVMGYFVNTLPAVLNTNDEKTFSELWSELAIKTYNLLRYVDFDLSELDCNHIKGTINSAFTYHKQTVAPHFKGCEVTQVDIQKSAMSFNLTGVVQKLDNDYMVEIGSGKYFEEIEIDKIFKYITDQILENSDIKIADIKTVDAHGIRDTYQYINHFEPLVGADTTVARFERMVTAYGDRIAVAHNDEEWTYEKLNQVSNRIAALISDRFSDTKQIAISLKRNNYLVATILGVLKSGKSYVPIDLMSPPKRIRYILNDLGNVSIIGEKQIIDNLTVPNKNKITIEEMLECINSFTPNNLDVKPAEKDGAYIIYTSGSTGDPKGVMVNHRNLISIIDCATKQFHFNKDDVWTLFHSYGFDFSVWEIFGCLLNGAKLIIIDNLMSKSPKDYYSLVIEKKVSILNLTPNSFIEFMNIDMAENCKTSLRYAFLGGETIYANSLRPWMSRHPETKLVNLYGITETSITSTFYEFTSSDLNKSDRNTIGSCFSNQGIYIVDKNLHILPKGIAGEILIYGDCVTDGYYNNAELTSKKFIKLNEISKDQLFYRSGDLALIGADNKIVFLGRIDKQVKLRGYRIELGEIENAIQRTGKVKTCVVEMASFRSNDEQLVAYVVTKDENFDQNELKNALRKTLQPYMVPTMIVTVALIPMTINGKIDFVSLRKNIKFQSVVSGITSETERKLSAIITEIAQTGNFSTVDNFFDVGINSMHLPSINNKVKQVFSLNNFEIVDLFQYTTVQTLAKFIDTLTKDACSQKTSNNIDRGSIRRNAIKGKQKGEL